jgi:hypothetical protein
MPKATADENGTPNVHSGEAYLRIDTHVTASADRHRTINIDYPVSTAPVWFSQAVDRLKGAPDCPKTITEVARCLEHEMDEAFRRHQVDARWGWRSIKHKMTREGWWERRNRP